MIQELHKVYPNRNSELRAIVMQMYEFGATVAQIPSASMSSGLDEHSIRRQKEYLEHANKQIDALNARPVPDLPATHPLQLPIDLSKEYVQFTVDTAGNTIPINETTQVLSELWLIGCVELAKSQSAAMPGAIFKFDYQRAKNNLAVIAKLVAEIEDRPLLDFPETAVPGASLEVPGGAE